MKTKLAAPMALLRMICALLCVSVVLFASGCASKKPLGPDERASERIDELRELVRKEIENPERVEAMLAILHRANAQVERQSEEMDAQLEAIREASLQYDTSREELEAMLKRLDEDALKILDALQDAHFEVKKLATEEEWAAIVEQERKFLGIF